MSHIFPTLFALDKNNKVKKWCIQVTDHTSFSTIEYEYGYIDGKKTTYSLDVKEGKNKGKKNETTHFEQAISDAKSRWDKKKNIDKYTEELNLKSEEQKNNIIPSPMLAQDFKKHQKKIMYPCYVQPKLDGYRMIYYNNKMYSRTGKEYTILLNSPLHKQLSLLSKSGNCGDIILDGELYVHGNLKFEQYGVLRKTKWTQDDLLLLNSIEYHIYDIVIEKESYENRLQMLRTLFSLDNTSNIQNIKLVRTEKCKGIEEIKSFTEEFLKQGYEGSMIRNSNGLYKQKYRSYDLLKNKTFDDAEFEIVDFTFEKDVLGKNDQVIVWICKNQDGKIFHVPSKGTREERNKLYQCGSEFVGKMLSVQYFGLTNDGIPRFPKSLREGEASIRED
jgi:DNA ligase-1